MKGRLVILSRFRGREAAALVVDGRLEDILIDPGPEAGLLPGAILRGTAGRPMKGQGGMFVTLPAGATGFLRESAGIAPGKPVIVQVTGAAEDGKAPPLTRRILFRSRHAIITPEAPGLNLSRRIRDASERDRLTALAEAGMAGCGFGLILRSAAEAADDEAVAADIAAMRQLAEAVMADVSGPPELLLDAPSPHEAAWRDWADPPPDEVTEGEGAFRAHGVDEMIAALASPRVDLPGGAHMAVEPTRALVAVDVNTGADTSPAAGLKANIAAARELPRQLRLRGLGGIVTLDLAPMPARDRATLVQQLKSAFKAEGAETTLAGWTPLGNYELQRRRDRVALARILAGLPG